MVGLQRGIGREHRDTHEFVKVNRQRGERTQLTGEPDEE